MVSGRNAILVVLDSARADAFSDAPVFEELSTKGLRFERAVAPSGWTIPSHVSMFSGLAPTEHGAIASGEGVHVDLANARRKTRALAEGGELLAPILRTNGVATFSSSPNPWVGPGAGLDAGFDATHFFRWLDPDVPVAGPPPLDSRVAKVRQVGRAMKRHLRWVRSRRDKGATEVLRAIDSFVGAAPRPFFVFVNVIETHEPHYPHESQRTRGRMHPKSLAETANVVLQPGLVRLLRMRAHNWGVRKIPTGLLERWKHAYAAEVRYADHWLGSLVETLERRGVFDETVVIVTGDHGESFGEGGIVGHGVSVREASVRVPLAVWGPGIPTEVVSEPVSLTAIRSTVEHIVLGREAERSLLIPAARGTAHVEIEDPVKVSRPPKRARRRSLGPGAAFYDGALKLAIDPFEGRALYDLTDDPDETHDVSGVHEPTARQSEMLAAWKARVGPR